MSVVKRIVSSIGARRAAPTGPAPRPPVQSLRERNNTGMLIALGNRKKHVYEGTVSGAEKAKRRAKNKAARIARRAGR